MSKKKRKTFGLAEEFIALRLAAPGLLALIGLILSLAL
jgi:hypothetical protein